MTNKKGDVKLKKSEDASFEKQKSLSQSQKAAVTKMLEKHDGSLGDKLAVVKTAHHIDKERFHSAFRRLMKG